ncbi:stage V sporulation protein D [Halobacillus andaensis]|uniref:serine-type D-Ala-D-Ala carboxypeptidase n=1 Tax=Halobacillus andaensis TaxID=1176239 RepID=A0A917ETZ1_HALAA|nr:stage V sporulation protein D [Halobacillus andaensis]MBP2003589.1 stage V sporulation protein D (sporulation-specific penicillin-binding protein) [Halobacillus andaensis]GGF11777.1 stage V sporulation protein D [Halobacillus andaensis]
MRRVSQVIVRKRLVAVFFVALLIFTVIVGRLGYVQFVLSDFLVERAEQSWGRDITFEPERGKIMDTNGEVLVGNQSAPTVMVVPRQIKEPEKTAEQLADILQMSVEKAYSHVTKQVSIEKLHPEGRKISEDKADAIQMLDLPGVYIAEDSERYYPNGAFLSHVLGFSGIDNQGLLGLESYYDEELKGEQGALSFFSDAKGKRMPDIADTYTPPVDGKDLQLTIDYNVQSIVERELDMAEAKYNPDGAIAIAVDPKTGKVKAMASRPNFHPSQYQDVEASIYNRNLPVWSTYEPGSTFKIITLAAALEEGLVNLEDEHFHDSGSVKVGGATLHCWKSGGHGDQTYLEVVQNSCNPGFVQLGERLGKDKLFEYIKRFGFGQKTGIDLEGEGSGILFQPEQIGPVEQATTAFGQGVSVTPIQQVMAVAAAVNGGYYYEPYVQEAWLDPVSGEVLEEKEPNMMKRVISEETSAEVRKSLESVVAKGTGRSAYVEGYRVGGKTGTAQKVGEDGKYMSNNHIVSFIGFAPADDPELVVYLAIDNPKGTVQFGGVVAAPIVGSIMEDSLRSLGVKPRKDGLDKEYAWPDEPLVEVPDVTGMKRKEIREVLTTLHVESSGEGDEVVAQAPKAGVKVPSDSTIRLYFNDD